MKYTNLHHCKLLLCQINDSQNEEREREIAEAECPWYANPCDGWRMTYLVCKIHAMVVVQSRVSISFANLIELSWRCSIVTWANCIIQFIRSVVLSKRGGITIPILAMSSTTSLTTPTTIRIIVLPIFWHEKTCSGLV